MTARKVILVADDEPSIREILAIQLARMDFEVVLASNGKEALELYEKHKPHLVILDLVMPQINGLDACQKIRSLEKKGGPRVPIIFLTARDSTHDKTTAALSGGDDFITKPVSLEDLRARVDAALRRVDS